MKTIHNCSDCSRTNCENCGYNKYIQKLKRLGYIQIADTLTFNNFITGNVIEFQNWESVYQYTKNDTSYYFWKGC